MPSSRPCVACLALVCLAGFSLRAGNAQVIVQQPRDDVPVIVSLSPVAIQLGQTAEIAITGERLEGLSKILCGDGVDLVEVVEAKEKAAKIRLRSAADARPGVISLHVLCTAGLSNPRPLLIDRFPQTVETQDNDALEKATPFELPGGVSGALGAGDRDLFHFSVTAGQGNCIRPTGRPHRIAGARLFNAARCERPRNPPRRRARRRHRSRRSPGAYVFASGHLLSLGYRSHLPGKRI